jgi:arylsulfatase A
MFLRSAAALSALAVSPLLSAVGAPAPAPAPANHARPNIVLILADDLGVGDVQSLYSDGKIPSPHTDRLVREGLHFTDAHSASAVCTPTRYALLTGRYAWRSRLQRHVVNTTDAPLIAPGQTTLPGLLRESGYHTGIVGKWHLGFDWARHPDGTIDYSGPVKGGPLERGFDHFFGLNIPNGSPYAYIDGERLSPAPTERLTDTEAPWVPPGPRIGYRPSAEVLPFLAPGPMAPGWRFDEIVPTLNRHAVRFVEENAKTEKPFFLYFSLTSPHVPIAPSPPFLGQSGVHPIVDFFVEHDAAVGEILDAIDRAGIADNTLVIYTADNGHDPLAYGDVLAGIGHRGSGPYRGHKTETYEGGHRVPFVVRWPGVVPPGARSDQLVSLNDLFPTLAEIAGAAVPPDAAPDAVSLLPAWRGDTDRVLRTDIIHHGAAGDFAIREGPWKLCIFPPGKSGVARRELYHLGDDPAETRDLAAAEPERVARLEALLQKQIADGRSTPGPRLQNDRPVNYLEYPRPHLHPAAPR